MTQTVSNVTFGMAFKAAVQSANSQGLYDVDSVSARTVELLEVIIKLAPEYGVDVSESSYGGGSKSQPSREQKPLPEGSSVFTLDGIEWIDFRGAKDLGNVKARHPEFKTRDFKTSVFMHDQQGDPNEDALPLVQAADLAKALA